MKSSNFYTTSEYLKNYTKWCQFHPEQKIFKHLHNHNLLYKTGTVASFALGLYGVSRFPHSLSTLRFRNFALGVAGAGLVCISTIAYGLLELLFTPKHDMKNHMFDVGKTECGELKYVNDVPILTVDFDDSYKAGKAQGFLLGKNLNILWSRFRFEFPYIEKLPSLIKEMKERIPREFLDEMQGVVDGFNEWQEKKYAWLPKWISALAPRLKLTLDNAILFHLIPDRFHFNQSGYKVGCAVIIDKDKDENNVVATNMDWMSLGKAGSHAYLLRRKRQGKIDSVEVTIPGLIGSLRAMKASGLCVLMNISQGTTPKIRGIPAILYNRMCIDAANTVAEVKQFVDQKEGVKPLGPYHLTVVDNKESKSFQMYPNSSSPIESSGDEVFSYEERQFSKGPFVVLNETFREKMRNPDFHYSQHRLDNIQEFFSKGKEKIKDNDYDIRLLLPESLRLPIVNNILTIWSMMMYPEKKNMEVGFDNAFSADIPKKVLTQYDLFVG